MIRPLPPAVRRRLDAGFPACHPGLTKHSLAKGEVTRSLHFQGFEPDDFDVFAIPDFAGRMAGIRDRVRPKLQALGEDLAPWLQANTGLTFFPRVALHARRTVNPPDDTWVAFGPSPRGYKRFGHFALGLSLNGVYMRFVLKPEFDQRSRMARTLRKEGLTLMQSLETWRGYNLYEDDHGSAPIPVDELTKRDLEAAAARLANVKSASLAVGAGWSRDNPTVRQGEALVSQAAEMARELLPLYLASNGLVAPA